MKERTQKNHNAPSADPDFFQIHVILVFRKSRNFRVKSGQYLKIGKTCRNRGKGKINAFMQKIGLIHGFTQEKAYSRITFTQTPRVTHKSMATTRIVIF